MYVKLLSSCAQNGLCLKDKLRRIVTKSVSNLSISCNETEEEDKAKIFYNSIIHKDGYMRPKYLERISKLKRSGKPVSIALKYLMNEEIDTKQVVEEKVECNVIFPYSTRIVQTDIEENLNQEIADFDIAVDKPPKGQKWMNDYEMYTNDSYEDNVEISGVNYGTSDPKVPSSQVPCGGCGAYLHCKDEAIPGFLPSEIFKMCNDKDLRALSCQRCHFLQNYNTALSVSVDPESYPKILSRIKDKKALVILMVDLTDFPCSIYPGILDIIGRRRPIFVVGNKVDLLWGDSKGWTNNVLKSLKFSFPKDANIKHISLISAKTGYGVEELINKLHNVWGYQGDVYLIGCTNVGKSTLFNSLLQSDYCKVKAVDILQRATTSPWPGTTLNLLKFPILRPEGWRLYVRTQRLITENNTRRAENQLRKEQMAALKMKPTEAVQLIGHIGRTFKPSHDNEVKINDSFSMANRNDVRNADFSGMGLDPNDKDFVHSKWVYDTPGVLHKDQILDLLTIEEVMKTVAKKIIEPRSFILKPYTTLFIGGIARLDYVEGNDSQSVWFTVFASNELPITVCNSENASKIYDEMVGTENMAVPIGGSNRMEKWPGLKPNDRPTKVLGIDASTSCVDFVLSSCGWIAVTVKKNEMATFLPWTPDGRGIHTRVPSLLPYAVCLRGKKLKRLPAYEPSKPYY